MGSTYAAIVAEGGKTVLGRRAVALVFLGKSVGTSPPKKTKAIARHTKTVLWLMSNLCA
jgi:hypothetical protein